MFPLHSILASSSTPSICNSIRAEEVRLVYLSNPMLPSWLNTRQHGGNKDISEGTAGQAAELGVTHQALHQRLPEKFSGTNPQSLSFERTLLTNNTCRPGTVKFQVCIGCVCFLSLTLFGIAKRLV